jgi:homoserine dehydrogenase
MKSIKIGLVGFGTVGTGVMRLLTEQQEMFPLVPKLHLGTKLVAKLCLAGIASQTKLGKEKDSQPYFLFWNFLPIYVTRG